MKANRSLMVVFLSLLVIMALAIGCSKKPSDSQIIGEVATKIQADPNIATKTISVQSQDGVVTLAGQVSSEMERVAAGNDASQIAGVRTVVNNLTVAAAAAPPMQEPVVEQQEPVKQAKSSARKSSSYTAGSRGNRGNNDYAPPSTPVTTVPATASSAMPAAKPKPTTVTIPDGTEISIRLLDPLDSEKNQVGDRFRGTLAHSITVGDQLAIPSGADVMGRIVDVKDAGHFSGKSVLAVELTNVSMGGKNYEVRTEEWRREGAARGKNTAAKVGGGAAVGAIIGAIAGGGKGAAIGSVIGAGAGTGAQAVTKGQQIRLPSETVMNFRLTNPLTVTPGAVRGDRPVLTDRTGSESE
ncbi:MAG TPA: BON domain-containing protein [Terriglobales bacterium]|nr:BON domain-containing protein [Terriglobales bacterium]